MQFLLKYLRFVFVILILGCTGISAKMQPLKDAEGRYSYPCDPAYPVNGAHEHYTVAKGVQTLGKFMAEMPARFISKLWVWCWSKQKEAEKPKASDPVALLKPLQTVPVAYSQEPKITWIGHATFLIQINGV